MKKIKKDKWIKTKFQDVVLNINKSIKEPLAIGINKSIGLENIVPNNLKIQSYVDIEKEGTKFSKLFKKGQFLFGSRRAYLRQMALADFDGVCTANIMVFDIKDTNKMTHGYLSMIIQSDLFVDYASGTSVGSLFPNAKWSSLANFNFPLPPLEEQKQIAALFQSLETAMEQADGQEKNLHQLKHKLLRDLFSEKQEFGNHLKSKDFETVKFEKIAINISERVEPKKTELTTYVGLEHLDADNLKIERTGTPDDVIGTKLKIYKGDIIFGKRRAYLRKVAVSHFDGIASAHSMILRANEKNIEKDFLPYFMQSDTFMSRAVQISEGSLSPTIKNKTLAVQEFILPKKEKQKELISVLKQFDTTMEQLKQQKTTLKNLKQKLLNEILG